MQLYIDDEMVDKITVENLLAALRLNREMATELIEREDDLEIFEFNDLGEQIRTCRHLEQTLAYFLTKEEFERRVGKNSPNWPWDRR